MPPCCCCCSVWSYWEWRLWGSDKSRIRVPPPTPPTAGQHSWPWTVCVKAAKVCGSSLSSASCASIICALARGRVSFLWSDRDRNSVTVCLINRELCPQHSPNPGLAAGRRRETHYSEEERTDREDWLCKPEGREQRKVKGQRKKNSH